MSNMLRDSRNAVNNFHLNSEKLDGTPKHGFLYYVRFVRANAGDTGGDWAKGIGILAKEISRPSITFDTMVANQYNRKRIIQRKVEYEPIRFTFHDTTDNKVLHLFEDYFRFYYGDPNKSSVSAWSWDIMSASLNNSQGSFGFIPPIGNPNLSYFFSHIEFYYISAGRYSRYDIVNPKIKSFSPSDMSYDSTDGAEIQIQLEYEGIIYQGNDMRLDQQDGLLQEMGIANPGIYEPRTNSGSALIETGRQYSKDAAVPTYNSVALSGLDSRSSYEIVNDSRKSSASISKDANFNSIFTGSLTYPSNVPKEFQSATPTQGDNIAKRIVNGLKS